MRALLSLPFLLLLGCPATVPFDDDGEVDTQALQAELEEQLWNLEVPGVSACVAAGSRRWCGSAGEADTDTGRAVTDDTVFLIASASKPVTALALLIALDEAGLGLDDEIGAGLDFPLAHPEGPIRYRELLAHTAGIADSDALDDWYATGADPSISLEEAMRGYFDPAGRWYDGDDNFLPGGPGGFAYSNAGSALAGWLAQERSGTDFAELTRSRIFGPLGLTRSGWHLADFQPEQLARPHEWDGARDRPVEHYTFADFPNGGLRTTAGELLDFALMMADGAELAPSSMSSSLFVQELRDQGDAVGLGWFGRDVGGDRWWYHDGAEQGAASQMWLLPDEGIALTLLMNGEPAPAAEQAAVAWLRRVALAL